MTRYLDGAERGPEERGLACLNTTKVPGFPSVLDDVGILRSVEFQPVFEWAEQRINIVLLFIFQMSRCHTLLIARQWQECIRTMNHWCR